MISGLAGWCAKRPLITLVFWIVLIGLSFFLVGRFLASALTTEQSAGSELESVKADKLLQERLGQEDRFSEIIIVKSDTTKFTDASFRSFVQNLDQKIKDLGKEVIESTVSFYSANNPVFVSKNQDAVLLLVTLAGDSDQAQDNVGKVEALVEEADKSDSFAVYEAGSASINKDFQEIAEKDLQKAEIFGIPFALIVLIIVFGAVGAAFLPVILSGLAIILALAATALFGQIYQLSFFVTNMITMMGLAVGIDYALFVISRFREERAKGLEKVSAIVITAETAGKAIFFSGLTVILALSGLLIVPVNVFRSLSLGAIFVVAGAVLCALTLLPALLSLLGDRVNFLRLPFLGANGGAVAEKGFWVRITKLVMAYPLISVEIAAGILILAAVPVLSLNLGSADVSSLPDELQSKKGFVILEQEFNSGLLSPTKVIIDADPNSPKIKTALTSFSLALQTEPTISNVQVKEYPDKKLIVVDVPISVSGEKGQTIIKKIRADYVPKAFKNTEATVLVGGGAASNLDFVSLIRRYNPIVFAFVLGLSFLFLLLIFRSIVIPLKAIIMNLLSTGAAYGLVVLVSQEGFGNEILGLDKVSVIEAWIPLFLFAILFGLSMDYHVFLLSRIKERFEETSNNSESVAFGIASTGRIITGAALIMVAVFAAFAAGNLTMFQQFGFGLAVAIFLDATIVRSVLVPASMQLLGNLNWYFPPWLAWLPNLSLERSKLKGK